MSQLLDIEEKDLSLPILVIYVQDSLLIKGLLGEFANKFRLIFISEKKPSFIQERKDIYFIDIQHASLLPKLEETIDYVLLFVSDKSHESELTPILTKASSDKAKVLFLADVFSLSKNIRFLKEFKNFPHVVFSVIGEVLTRKKSEAKGELSKIIDNAIANREIRLTGNELFPVYGISESDAITGISRLLFGNFENDSVYQLFYEHPRTILESAHLIGRIEQEIKITFSETNNSTDIISRQEVSRLLTTELGKEGKHLDSSFAGFEKAFVELSVQKDDEIDDFEKPKKKRFGRKKNVIRKSHLSFVFFSIFFGGFVFIFVNLLLFGLSLLFLKNALSSMQKNEFKNVSQNARVADTFLSFVKPSVNIFLEIISPLEKKGTIEKNYLLLERVVGVSKIVGDTSTALSKKSIDIRFLNTTLANLSYLYQEGQRLALETDNKVLREELKPTYSKLLSFSSVIPAILGFNGDRNYLLLFQNNEELRPTGGFIGSIGDMRVRKGKAEELSIQDVYELDGQLRNHVEPPFIVRRYLQPHLYLRDSNFSLNYQETASKAAFIYNLESGKRPDAVIAIDLRVLKEILKLSGPIQLSSYNVTVTTENVSEFLQSTIKNNFFPGSTQKKDVLNSVFNQLSQKFSSDSKFYFSILKLLPDLFEQKDILVSFSDDSVQKIFSANNYSGEYARQTSPDPKEISDFLYINEANIGVNKVNADVTREVSYETMLGQGSVVSKANLTLKNTSKTDDYKVYIKLAVPLGSSINQITINGIKQNITPAITDFKVYEAKNFKAPSGLETEQFSSGNLTYFAFIATAKTNQSTSIEVDYNNGAGRVLTTVTNYKLSYIKQPGTAPYNVTTTIDYPEGYVPIDTRADSYGKNFLETKNVITNNFETSLVLQKSSVQK